MWSGAVSSNGECGPGMEGQTEGVVLGFRVKIRVWSRDGGSN